MYINKKGHYLYYAKSVAGTFFPALKGSIFVSAEQATNQASQPVHGLRVHGGGGDYVVR